MGLFDQEVVSSFATVPFDKWSTVLTVIERMLTIEKAIEFMQSIEMWVLGFCFDDNSKLSFVFLERKQELEEGWQDLVLSRSGKPGK